MTSVIMNKMCTFWLGSLAHQLFPNICSLRFTAVLLQGIFLDILGGRFIILDV